MGIVSVVDQLQYAFDHHNCRADGPTGESQPLQSCMEHVPCHDSGCHNAAACEAFNFSLYHAIESMPYNELSI